MTPRVRISADDRALLTLAKARFKQEEDATEKTRQRELADLGFYAGDQWDADTAAARQMQSARFGVPPVPARPCLTINKVKEPVRQVLNQERESNIGIELIAADDFEDVGAPTDDTEIRVREGLMRRIQRAAEAADARTWAFSRAVIAGRGFYAIMTRYLPGKSWYQEPYVHRIFNQSSVSLDPAHEQPDGSDAEWGFIGNDIPWAQYEHDYPKNAKNEHNPVVGSSDAEFRAIGADAPDWFTEDGDTRSVRVVDYWYTERTHRTLVQLPDGRGAWKDELPPGTATIDERAVVEKQIKFCKIDGVQVLEKTDWLGPNLPIIKVLGEELHPYDHERRTEGMIRSARDAQQGFNAMVSKWVESVGLAPIPPFQATPEQIAGFEAWYQLANTRTLPYLPYNSTSEAGQPIGPPTRTNIDTPIQAIAASVSMFDEAIQSTTGVPESRVGRNSDSRLRSGKAIESLKQSSEQGTSNYLDNLKRSMRYEGEILNNLLFPLYGQPGRLVRIINGEGDEETVRVQVPGQQPIGPPAMPRGGNPAPDVTLTKDAKFNVVVKITRAFDTRRQEEAAVLSELMSANPLFMTWFGDLYFKNQDGPGHTEMAERAKAMLDPKIQQMLQAKQQGSIPPELAQAMAAKDEQLQHAEAAMKELSGQLESKQQDTAAKVKIAEIGAEKDVRIQEMRDATAIAVAHIAAASKGASLEAHAAEEGFAMGHEVEQAEQDRDHEAARSAQDHAEMTDAAATAHMQEGERMGQDVAGQAALGEQAHSQALEQGQQAAALAPPLAGDTA